ncbi:MAG: pitrilysin family protein, partial [Nannocystaceae bacterium]
MKALRSLLAPCASLLLLACTPAPTTGGAVSPVTPAPATEAPDEAAILASSDLPPQLPEPLPDDPLRVTVHRLSNGMTVYLSTVRDEPQIHAWIVVRAGGRMDPADSTGLAHYLEHMLFKGTDELGTLDFEQESAHVERVRQLYAELREATGQAQREAILAEIDVETLAQAEHAIPNEFDRLYGTLGVEGLNAWTSSEETVYLATVPSNRLEQWARVESERFSDPVFRLFYPELEAVYEEKNLSLDEPVERLDELVMPRLFPEHPYGTQTILGSVEHLRTPAYQDMVDFFEQHYVPNNMAVVLVGDIDADTALPVLERELGRMRPRPLVAPPPGALAELPGRQQVELLAEGEEQITLRWPTVAVGHADEPALEVLGTILGDPAFGRLETELVLPQEVTWAAAGSSIMNEAGYFQVDLGLRPGQRHEDVEAMALRVIGSLRRGELADADVDAAKLQMKVAVQRQREAAFMRAYWLLESFVQHRSWAQTLEHERALQRVTAKDVVRVAEAYLGDAYVAGYRREGTLQVPRLDKPKISPVPVDASRRSPFFEAVQGMPVSPLQPRWAEAGRDYQRRELAAGELIAVHNVRNELFSVQYSVERGYRAQPRLCLALEL